MKKVISLFLSAVMVVSMCYGINFSALAKDVTKIEYSSAEPLTLYEGSDSYTSSYQDEHDVWHNYEYYNISQYDLLEKGNTLTVFYDDNTSEVYTCKEVFIEDEGYYTDRFATESGKIMNVDDLSVYTGQGKDNLWTPGNSYTYYVEYMGQRASATVNIVENPVKSISVDTGGKKITVFENCCGENDLDGDDNKYFSYYGSINYLRMLNAVITVTMSDDTVKTYTFTKDEWMPVDEDGNVMERDKLNLFFDQYNEHLEVGKDGKAYAEYYGRQYELPVEVVEKHDVDEGALTVDETESAFFYNDEWHSFTFTPEETGRYRFNESLASRVSDEDFECVCTVNGEVVPNNFEWDDLIYIMEAGETYTLKFRKADPDTDDGLQVEYLSVSGPSIGVSDFKFIPEGGEINAYEGERYDAFSVYEEGNAIEFTLTNGDEKRFVCDEGDFIDEDTNEDFWDYCESVGLDDDLHYEANREYWAQGEDAYLTFIFNGARCKVDVNILPSPIKGVAINPANEIKVYEGTAEKQGDDEDEFDHYDVDKDMFFTAGSTITVTNNDNTQEIYTYKSVSGNEDYYEAFVSESGKEIFYGDINISDGQSVDNQWTVGNTYPIRVYYKGKYATVNVKVESCPVKSVSVTLDNPITLFKNCAGEERYDDATRSDFFNYYCDYNYLRVQHAKINVTYSDNTVKTFSYKENVWNAVDENDNEIENRYLDFYFDQYGTKEKNETPVATVSYYQKEANVPVQIVDKHDVNDGALELLKSKSLFFIEDETHTFTFTPANSGGYIFAESILWRVIEDGDYSFEVKDSNGEAVQRINDDTLAYNLEGGKTYTITTKNLTDACTRLETVGVYPYVYVTDFEFTPVNPLEATEGERFDDRQFLYVDGTKIKVTLSNGDVSTFTAVDNGNRFVNENGRSIESFLEDENIDGEFYVTPSHDFWEYGEESYITIAIGNKEKQFPVEVQESHVSSIQFTPAKPVEIIKDMIWYYEWDDEYVSEIVDMIAKPGDVLTVNYNDGRGTVNYVMSEDEEVFVNENDPTDKIRTEFFYDQTKEYNIGDTINFTLSFQTATTGFTGTVVENPVLSAVYTPASPFEFNENQDGHVWERERYDGNSDEYVKDDFFCYNEKDIFAQGSTFTVTYREGNRTETYTSDGKNFVSEGGEKLPNPYIGALWGRDQYESPFLPDKDNFIKVHFMSYETPVKVTVNHVPGEPHVENASPASCTKEGSYDLVIRCTECNKVLNSEPKTLDKTAHTVVNDAAVPPTFTAAGKTTGKHCSVCKTVIVQQKPVAQLVSPVISKFKKSRKSFKVEWNKAPGVDGYQVQYGLKKNFKKSTTKWVKPNKTKLTVKKLKSKKKYYVRIRAYKMINGQRVYSAWSTSKVKTK